MKVFISTLAAILVAAVIIGIVVSTFNAMDRLERAKRQLKQLDLQKESGQAQMEWDDQVRANPNFDPGGEKLTKRLAEIKDAIDNGKPIPPNLWQTESPVVNVPATAPAPTLIITLKESVSIQTESATVTLPVGTALQYVSKINDKVHVHYLNSDYYIPISATDLKHK